MAKYRKDLYTITGSGSPHLSRKVKATSGSGFYQNRMNWASSLRRSKKAWMMFVNPSLSGAAMRSSIFVNPANASSSHYQFFITLSRMKLASLRKPLYK